MMIYILCIYSYIRFKSNLLFLDQTIRIQNFFIFVFLLNFYIR